MSALGSLRMRFVVWVWRHTPNCAEMSRLASRSLDRPLGLGTRARMRLHHLICVWCQRYAAQVRFLHQAAAQCEERGGAPPGAGLSAEARRRLLERLRKARKAL